MLCILNTVNASLFLNALGESLNSMTMNIYTTSLAIQLAIINISNYDPIRVQFTMADQPFHANCTVAITYRSWTIEQVLTGKTILIVSF